jgi:hypothetical protein
VRLTEAGRARYASIDRRQVAWVNDLAAGMRGSDLEIAAGVLGELSRRLESANARRKEESR